MPFQSSSVWLELVPRVNSEVCWPAGPDWVIERPGTVVSSAARSVTWRAAISRWSRTVAEAGVCSAVLAVERGSDDDGVAEAGDRVSGPRPGVRPRGLPRSESGRSGAWCAPFGIQRPTSVKRMGAEREHESARNPSPAPRGRRCGRAAGLLASGSSYSRAFPRGRPFLDLSRAVARPVSYPVTVAGAAPVSHRLPSSRRENLPLRGGSGVTAPSGLSKKPPTAGGLGELRSTAAARRRRLRPPKATPEFAPSVFVGVLMLPLPIPPRLPMPEKPTP